jgi:hypothetical protein
VLLGFTFRNIGLLPAPPTAASTEAASPSGSHAGGAAAAAAASIRSAISPRTPSEGITVSATAAREIPASDPICSAAARSVAKTSASTPVGHTRSAGPIAHAGSGAVAR